VPVAAADAGKCSHIVVAAVMVFGQDFFDSFFGRAFGAKNYFSRGTTSAKFRGEFVVGAFVFHNSVNVWTIQATNCLSL
jgi:CDP-diglyceride synthetase